MPKCELYTIKVAYYEPVYYEHSLIMNQAEGPNKYTPIALVLNQARLIWSLCIMNKIFGPKEVHNKSDPECTPWPAVLKKTAILTRNL